MSYDMQASFTLMNVAEQFYLLSVCGQCVCVYTHACVYRCAGVRSVCELVDRYELGVWEHIWRPGINLRFSYSGASTLFFQTDLCDK